MLLYRGLGTEIEREPRIWALGQLLESADNTTVNFGVHDVVSVDVIRSPSSSFRGMRWGPVSIVSVLCSLLCLKQASTNAIVISLAVSEYLGKLARTTVMFGRQWDLS